jgi:hypothetical protein
MQVLSLVAWKEEKEKEVERKERGLVAQLVRAHA